MRYHSIGITNIILYIIIVIKLAYSKSCGGLSIEPDTVQECRTARLSYTPNTPNIPHTWYLWYGDQNEPIVSLYDSETINRESKYIEEKRGNQLILRILTVDLKDNARYIVGCNDPVDLYTNWESLRVTPLTTGEGCMGKCGDVFVRDENIEEGDQVEFEFTVYPGRTVTLEKKHGLTFSQLVNKRYRIKTNLEKTVHSLVIIASEYSDGGEYRVNCGDYVSNSINLTVVYRKPSVPEFSNVVSTQYCKPDGCILANLNEEVTVECFVKGGSNPIDLNMLKNGNTLINVTKILTDINGISYNYVKYSFAPTKMDVENNVTLTCLVKNPAVSALSSNSTMLFVKVYPEKIHINPVKVVEDKQGEVQCIEPNVRPPLKARFFIYGREEHNTTKVAEIMPGNLYNVTTSTTILFTRIDNQAEVSCCSTLDNLICEKSKLNVLFPPKYMSVDEISKENQENGDTIVQLKVYVAESNPKSLTGMGELKQIKRILVDRKYEQTKDNHGWTLSELWSFKFTRDDNTRQITFEAVTEGFPDLTLHKIFQINVTYYPIVMILGQITVYHGDDVILVCQVNSNPPSSISWYNQTDLIQETHGGDKSILYIQSISTNDLETYVCTASNGIGGIKSKTITLIVKDPFERTGIQENKPSTESNSAFIVGSIIGSLVTVIIIVIIVGFLIYRRRQNTQLEIRKTNLTKSKEQKTDIGNRNNGSETNGDRQSSHEMNFMLPDNSMEIHVYSEIATESSYEALSKQGTSKESELYTNLDKQAQYEALTKQGTSESKIDIYTGLDHTSSAVPSEYENVTN